MGRPARCVWWLTLLLAAVSGAQAGGAQQSRRFTVAVMVQAEGVGEVQFAPSGDRLLVERLSPYASSRDFAWNAWGRERSSLLDFELGAGGSPSRQLLSASWIGSYSPGGSQVAIGWFDGDAEKSGVYDFRTGELRRFDLLLGNAVCEFDCPIWLSEGTLLQVIASRDAQLEHLSPMPYVEEQIAQWERDSWQGGTPALQLLGSGRYQSAMPMQSETLAQVDALTGQAITIARGAFVELKPSPDRKRVATLDVVANLPLRNVEVRANLGAGQVHQLTVHDLGVTWSTTLPCPHCNVMRSSLRWSPHGKKLFFSTRNDAGLPGPSYIYDLGRKKLELFAPAGLPFTVDDAHYNVVVPFVWLDDDTPAIRVPRAVSRENNSGERRYDWYTLSPRRAPVWLTRPFAGEAEAESLSDFVAVRGGRLYLMVRGHLWALSSDGRRTDLTAHLPGRLSPWCSVLAYWRVHDDAPTCSGLNRNPVVRSPDQRALDLGWLTFRELGEHAPIGDVLFLNVDSGAMTRVRSPDTEAELISASAVSRAAVFLKKGSDGDRLVRVTAAGHAAELLRFNEHLSGIAPGQPVMLSRQEEGDIDDRIDWLLLPPNHVSGQRHPLLVYFYPGAVNTAERPIDDLRRVDPLNMQLAAAVGYAVLMPTVRAKSTRNQGDPMLELHEQLIHAAENAVRRGYVDPERWALMGHSFGGYGTNAVITQTKRFEAAVSLDGMSNLTSSYAIGLSSWVNATRSAAELPWGVVWAEGGQAHMGAPPWVDPDRYLRNSPIFGAPKIETPLLLIHGDLDLVNVNESEQMFNALHRQGKDALLVRYWGEGHLLASPSNIRDMWHRIYAWVDAYLDIARDVTGNVEFSDGRVVSRGGSSPFGPDDFARFESNMCCTN